MKLLNLKKKHNNFQVVNKRNTVLNNFMNLIKKIITHNKYYDLWVRSDNIYKIYPFWKIISKTLHMKKAEKKMVPEW